jgi:hypothetical protein
LNVTPHQYDSQSPAAAPSEAAIQIGTKAMPLTPISAPMPTNATVAGISSEMKASDSPNASANTIGSAQPSLSRTNSMTYETVC